MERILTKINIVYGGLVAFFTAVFGQYWFLFIGFLACNIIDYITGCIKAWLNGKESSKIGAKGVLKKVMYWVVIGIAFFISLSFMRMGELLGIDLRFVVFFGWFTLATYLVNEIRSILENLVEMGVNVPKFLIKGLEVADKAIDKLTNK